MHHTTHIWAIRNCLPVLCAIIHTFDALPTVLSTYVKAIRNRLHAHCLVQCYPVHCAIVPMFGALPTILSTYVLAISNRLPAQCAMHYYYTIVHMVGQSAITHCPLLGAMHLIHCPLHCTMPALPCWNKTHSVHCPLFGCLVQCTTILLPTKVHQATEQKCQHCPAS